LQPQERARRSAPISQVEVEQEILRLIDLLEQGTEDFESLSVDSAVKDSKFKSEWAKAYLQANGSVKEREAMADLKMTDIMRDHKIADALVKSKREKLSSLKTQIDALRTLAANVRHQT
jgi:hypothetical protein